MDDVEWMDWAAKLLAPEHAMRLRQIAARFRVVEDCCERLVNACTDAGCPDSVRMGEWIRENCRAAPHAIDALSAGQERNAFEYIEQASELSRDEEGQYKNPCVQSAWDGWQARAALNATLQNAEPFLQWCKDNGRLPGNQSKANARDDCADAIKALIEQESK